MNGFVGRWISLKRRLLFLSSFVKFSNVVKRTAGRSKAGFANLVNDMVEETWKAALVRATAWLEHRAAPEPQ